MRNLYLEHKISRIQLRHPAVSFFETLDFDDVLLVVFESRKSHARRVSFRAVVGQEVNSARQLLQMLQELGKAKLMKNLQFFRWRALRLMN
jgi:hypothetical protein